MTLKYANKLKCKIKLVAESFKCKGGIYTSVKPILVDKESILAILIMKFMQSF